MHDGLIDSDRASIFGDTYAGVPNPQIPFEHAYPTRYHGPIFTIPRFGLPYMPRPYALAPYSGLGAMTETQKKVAYFVAGGAVVGVVVGALAYKKKRALGGGIGLAAGGAAGLALATMLRSMPGAGSPKPAATSGFGAYWK
jgi:hypothetical protein